MCISNYEHLILLNGLWPVQFERKTSTAIRAFITAPFNNMQTLKFKAQPTGMFFATVNQMFRGSSQLSITAERPVIKSNR